MIAPPRAATACAPLVEEPWPIWVTRMFPEGLPLSDPLAWEVPASDAQIRYLAYLGVRGRWCSRDEAKQLISRIKRGQKAAKAKAPRLVRMRDESVTP